MPKIDLEYYRPRVATERGLAKSSDRENVSAIHEELARQYEALMQHEELRLPLNSVVQIRHVA